MKGIAVLAVAVASASWLGPWSARAVTGPPVRNGLIFYDTGSGGRGGGEIYAVRPNGSGRHRVARNHALEPSVSADGRSIVFQAGTGIGLMNPDGSHRRVIDVLPGKGPNGGVGAHSWDNPSLSPDGSEIVFGDSSHSIWEVRTDGSQLRRVVSLHHSPGRPVFAPNGQAILFEQAVFSTGRLLGLFLMDPDGTHVRAVPNTKKSFDGAFSPDGETIVFAHNRGIYRMRLDGSQRRRLTHPPAKGRGGAPPPDDGMPAFSPDGTKIVFVRSAADLPGGGWSGPHGLFIVNADGSHLRRLSHSAFLDPSWQPVF